MLKKAIVCLALAVSGAFITGCNSEDMTVYIGTQDLAAPEAIAEAENWFEEEMKCDVEMVEFVDGLEISKAMASGQIDFGLVGSVPTARNISRGMKCQVICIQSVLGDVETLVVNKNDNIDTAEKLKGKTIATLFSSTAHYSLLKYLDVNGIRHDDVNIIHMMVSDIVPAFENHEIDGAFIWEPQLSEIISRGGEKLTSAKEVAEMGYATLDLELVRTDFANEHPELVKKYIACIDKAVKLYQNDPEKACRSLSKVMKTSEDVSQSRIESSTWLNINEQAESEWFSGDKMSDTLYDTAMFLYEQGFISDAPNKQDYADAVNSSFVKALK